MKSCSRSSGCDVRGRRYSKCSYIATLIWYPTNTITIRLFDRVEWSKYYRPHRLCHVDQGECFSLELHVRHYIHASWSMAAYLTLHRISAFALCNRSRDKIGSPADACKPFETNRMRQPSDDGWLASLPLTFKVSLSG